MNIITQQVLTMVASILIYTTSNCPYCVKAKALFDKKQCAYQEINVEDAEERAKMIKISGGRTSVPQIFINGQHLGGCDDLYALDKAGDLDKMLQQEK